MCKFICTPANILKTSTIKLIRLNTNTTLATGYNYVNNQAGTWTFPSPITLTNQNAGLEHFQIQAQDNNGNTYYSGLFAFTS